MPLRFVGASAAVGLASLVVAAAAAPAASRPLLTAVADPAVFSSPDVALGFRRTRQAGAALVRINAPWSSIAPGGRRKPSGFDAADPADRRYAFGGLDRLVRLAVASGLQPVVGFHTPPRWATDQTAHPASVDGFPAGPYKPSPAEIGAFAHALAARYSGSFQGLPRVRYWLLWNEPNLIGFVSPQFENGRPFAPGWYRRMLGPFSASIHSVHRDNVVVAGALAAFHHGAAAIGPLTFLRSLLCMSSGRKPQPTCSTRLDFDALSVHPYTSGGPTHHAASKEDVSLGDLPEVQRLLQAAVRAHHVRSSRPVQLWVTEFSWDTRPPDPNPLAAPITLQARWTSEAMYRMWAAGVRVVTWSALRDLPWPGSAFQAGLYFRSGIDMAHDLPKPTLTAFSFPFVDLSRRKARFVWARTPGGRPGRVVVEQRTARGWRRLAVLRTNRDGIVSTLLGTRIVRPRAPKQPVLRTTYRATVLADRPEAYWRLGEERGTTARDLTGRHAGVALGGVSFGAAGALSNDRNTAVCLNGRNARIELGPIASPSSVEVWAKTRSSADTPFFSNRTALGQYEEVGSFLHLAHVFDSFGLVGERSIADNRWHQVVYTYAGITGRVYVDGRLQAEDTWIRAPGQANARLGFDAALGSYFRGCLDEVSLYNHLLPAARVLAHFRASGRKLAPVDLGALRARLAGSRVSSLPFPLTPPRDRKVLPFGG